ncbi:MAG: FeoA family protein [Deinococcales bacterium]|jgi:ferrous iron transport protein A
MRGGAPDVGDATALSSLRRGERARVERIEGSASLAQRLRMFGIRPGIDVLVLHGPNGRGAVLQVGGGRIALGRAVVDRILVASRNGTEGAPNRLREAS